MAPRVPAAAPGGTGCALGRGRRPRRAGCGVRGLRHERRLSGRGADAPPLLASLSSHALDELTADAREERVQAREWLFRANDAADACFVVITGRLEVIVDTDDGERVARVLGPGAAIGELALLTGEPRSASVRALRDSR